MGKSRLPGIVIGASGAGISACLPGNGCSLPFAQARSLRASLGLS